MKTRANNSALIDLDRLLDGTLLKRFGVEWEKVLDNCYDMRAAATKPRTITLKISVIPNIGRDACDIKADITTRLQPAEALKQMTYMRQCDDGTVQMQGFTSQVPGQIDMDGKETPAPNVIEFSKSQEM